MDHKAFSAEVKAATEEGTIEAIVSVFENTDRGGEIVRTGAFEKSLQQKMPKGVWHHDWTTPVAKTLEAKELSAGDPRLPANLKEFGGLYIKGQFNLETQAGREAFSNIKFGIIDEFSIGYRVVNDQFDTKSDIRELLEVELFEWSPVLVGMNPATTLISVKQETSERVPFSQQLDVVLANLRGVVTRAKDISALRAKDNRTLSAERRKQLTEIRAEIDALVQVPEPDEANQAYLAYLKTASQYAGR